MSRTVAVRKRIYKNKKGIITKTLHQSICTGGIWRNISPKMYQQYCEMGSIKVLDNLIVDERLGNTEYQ